VIRGLWGVDCWLVMAGLYRMTGYKLDAMAQLEA
jgi:hypothetical protein